MRPRRPADDPAAPLPKRRRRRLAGFDYRSGGAYFVTICLHGGKHLFGEIAGEEVELSPAGRMVASLWWGLETRFEGLQLDEWVVMPDHVHGILFLDGGNNHASLDEVIGAYKSITTRLYIQGVHDQGWPLFNSCLWQRSYHDHVIRGERSLTMIREYIRNNPLRSSLPQR